MPRQHSSFTVDRTICAARRTGGFTLIELLLAMTILGLALALIIPRAMRAQTDSKFSQVRQYGSEISSYIMTYVQNQARAQRSDTNFTLKDFLYDDIEEEDGAGVISKKLVDKYTGNDDFNGLEKLIPSEKMPQNPFNQTSYFSKVNDDAEVPSKKAGLLYLAGRKDPRDPDYINFYLLFTSTGFDAEGSRWHGDMDHLDPDKIRRGVFVARLFDDKERGAKERIK